MEKKDIENESNSLIVQEGLPNKEIKNLIYTVKGKQVMLDSDVALLYHYETKKSIKPLKEI